MKEDDLVVKLRKSWRRRVFGIGLHYFLDALLMAAFELLKWRIFPDTHLRKAVSILLSSADDPNWQTRSTTLTFLRSFKYRHTFILLTMRNRKSGRPLRSYLQITK